MRAGSSGFRPGVWAVLLAAAGLQWAYVCTGAPPVTWDDAWYLETSYRLFDALKAGPLRFLSEYVHAFQIKAPLIALLPLPLYLLSGKNLLGALFANTLCLLALGWYASRIARRFYGDAAGVLAALTLNTFPLVYGLSRRFYVELPLALLVAAWMHHLLASEGLRRKRQNTALGVLLGLGLLMKVLFPLYAFCPTAVYLWDRRRAGGLPPARELESAAKRILGIGAAIALTWYASNWLTAVGFAFRAGLGDAGAVFAGPVRVFSLADRLRYLHAAAAQGVSWYYAAAGGLLLLYWAAARRDLLERLRALARDEAFRFLSAWIVPPLLFFSFQTAGELRYAAPLLPAAAVALAGGLLVPLSRVRWSPLWTALFFLLPLDLYAHHAFGRSLLPHPGSYAYNEPRRGEPAWDLPGLLDGLAGLQGGRGGTPTVAVGIEHPALNANRLSCLAAQRGVPLRFIHLGDAQDSVEKALIRLREKDAAYALVFDGVPASELPIPFNRVNAGFRKALDAGRLGFRLKRAFPLGDGVQATLYER
ncbi:MAG: hypothetical protein A2X36_01920 [Elusimicrobia bacterium GWA2_69_24]|nr:MAG: hypothetical protein A2X36_01920 [Elusimicrobia bacterium GWA2_69_24]HBL16513.1 hypothetical protein [Elusimicrobiota bacterium]